MRFGQLLLLMVWVSAVACGASEPAEPDNPGARTAQLTSVYPDAPHFPCDVEARPADPDRTCSTMGCEAGARVVSQGIPSGGWMAGDYVYEVSADGQSARCTGTLPMDGCHDATIRCDQPWVNVTAVGCASSAVTDQSFGDLQFDGCPRDIRVRVMRDETEIGTSQATMTYSAVQPNGEGCSPVCAQGSTELRF